MIDISIFVAFTAGIVSFLSPCILPVIPGYLAYLGGVTTDSEESGARKQIFLNSLFFVLGFSVVFAVLGIALNSFLVDVASGVQTWLARLGGVVIIIFGLYLTGLLRIPFLEVNKQITVKKKFNSRYLTSFIFGSAFAAGWTPCVGAILGAILGLAISSPGSAFFLLLGYSLGLAIPFLLVGLFASGATKMITKYAKSLKYVNIVFGVMLIIIGVFAFTESLALITSFEFINKLVL
ncbi:cytochrome C biogenesis protein [Candidatus Campbellbacteria bacterium CG22_combo_CG10-13_8_21_14_all_36_13]|uniref:Cytochrome C biogenesis protein n=1 Tax=Candidatus Campbellbacteria bacterium CG22_combo_CG10-13_8_21_14_all_36_13 TaxID=1974529 RepID=A0A2H0DZR2_9BACT|nr:MAG: cytochrome C biogenesis protein [Candidatus Campbellbacteria bacterium CG22_combo_CG10-13_8_21_14_all_36_13]